VKIKIDSSNPSKKKTEMLCGFVFENSDKILGLNNIDSKISPSVKQSLKDINGEMGKIVVVPTNNKVQAKRILLAGIGKKEKFTNDTIRFVSGKIAQKAKELKLKEFAVIVPSNSAIETISASSQIIEGCKMSLYKFEKFKSKKEGKSPDLSIFVPKSNKVSNAIKNSEIISDGVIFTKGIANLPPNECTPTSLATFAKMMAKENKMKCIIFSKNELTKKGFGGISAVG
jgi:leucyl aminopeptidase